MQNVVGARDAVARLAQTFGDSVESLRDVLNLFVDTIEPIRAQIHRVGCELDDSDETDPKTLPESARVAHRIANHMGVLQVGDAVAAANRMEQAARAGDLQGTCTAAVALEPMLTEVLEAVRERLATMNQEAN